MILAALSDWKVVVGTLVALLFVSKIRPAREERARIRGMVQERVMSRLRVDGKTREDIVDRAIKERRANVYTPAPNMSHGLKASDCHVVYAKSAADRATILAALQDNFVFSSLKASDCSEIVDYMEPEQVPAGTDVIVQGDPAVYFYIVQQGTLTVLQGAKKVGALTAGQSFGETGLLYDSPRNATIRAEVTSHVWKLDRHTFKHLLATAATSQQLDVMSALKAADILKGLSEPTLTELAECAVEVDYKMGQTIVKKGEHGALGYFIMQGTVRVTDLPKGIPDVTYGPGQHFGLQALLTGETRNATVVADTDVIVAALSQQDIGEMLGDVTQLFLQDHQAKQLVSIPLFSEFSSEMITSLLQAMHPKHFVAGDRIIQQGEIGTTFYLIESGTCNVLHRDEEGTEKVVKKLDALQYFGEMALLRNEARSADVVAVTDCEVLEMEQATFQRIFGSSIHFSRQLNEVVKGRRKSLQRIQHPVENITMDELNTIKILGSGTFGVVTLVQHKHQEDCFYALKAMSIEFIERHKQEENIIGEKRAMLECDHPFILRIYSTMRDSHRIFFLIEYCDGGELFNVLHNKDRDFVPEHQAKFYAACEVLALEHLALRSMAYRDLKPENTLVDSDGYCKMIDMGFAKVIKGKSYTFCGTPEYLAPEIILGSGHNRAVDYFALGVLIYEMICGQTPFYDYTTDGILRNIVRGKLRFGPKFTDPIKDIITKLLSPNPVKRLGMLKGGVPDIIQHPWFSDIDFDQLIQKKVEAPWKPESTPIDASSTAMEAQSVSIVPVDEDYESSEEWLNNFGPMEKMGM